MADKSIFLCMAAAMLFFSGCQATHVVNLDPALNSQNAAVLHIYRPSSDWAGLAIDFRVTAGETELGSLGAGDAIEAVVPATAMTVRVQPHFLGIKDGRPAEVDVTLSPGDRRYLRFSQFVDGVIPIGGTTIVTGGGQLVEVSAAEYEARR